MLKNNFQKGFISLPTIAGIAVVVVVVAIISVYATIKLMSPNVIVTSTPTPTATLTPAPSLTPTSTPDATANWKIYANSKYGYEIKYQSDWSTTARGDYQIHFLAPETPKFDANSVPGEGNIYIVMAKLQANQSATPPQSYSSKSTISVDGVSATRYEGVKGGQDVSNPSIIYTIVQLVKDNKKIEFLFSNIISDTNDDKYIAVFNEMLSTFKFTGTDITADWQTYTNTKNGFEVKYPNDFKINESQDSPQLVTISKILCCQLSFDNGITLKINYIPNTIGGYPDMNDVLKNKKLGLSSETFSVQKYNYGNFEGVKAVSISSKITKEEHINLYLKAKDGFYSFTWDSVDPENKGFSYTNYLIPVLSTFKFTNKSISSDDQASAKLFCQSLVASGYKLGTFGYFSNSSNEKFADCGIGSADSENPGGVHIIIKHISGIWTKIWTGNGSIPQDEITRYNIPKEIVK